MKFKLESSYKPSGDQPEAIDQLCSALSEGVGDVTLLGVTGSGKTFTMANVIERLQRPALILSHNKTLAAQLYGEFKSFFPANAVEYFVSYYDYYQPEAYIPSSDTYIEKDLSINDQIEKLRLSAASALLSGRRDVIVISSVSCLYGIGNPDDFHEQTVIVRRGERRSLTGLLYKLVDALYNRTEVEFKRGTFRVRGDTVDVFLGGSDNAVRIEFFGDEVDALSVIDPVTGARIEDIDEISIYPANNFVTTKERSIAAVSHIQDDLVRQMQFFEESGRELEAKRLKQRVEYDLEMIKEMGYCPGIENYSRYFDGRKEGQRPFCLIDYFPKDFITFIDESHVTLPQIHAMYGGDHSRKSILIDYGFRLPAAADNRPLKFEEFEALTGQKVYVSATPADYELEKSGGLVVEQVVRPTGLLDPPIEVRPTKNQVDDLVEEIRKRSEKDERVLVTTLTKRMAEELDDYLRKIGIRVRYIHSDVDTAERVEIIEDFKGGLFDVLVRARGRQPAQGGARHTLGFARGDTRRRQGGLPAHGQGAHADGRQGRAQCQRTRDNVRRLHHPLDGADHPRDQPPAQQADSIQQTARHHSASDRSQTEHTRERAHPAVLEGQGTGRRHHRALQRGQFLRRSDLYPQSFGSGQGIRLRRAGTCIAAQGRGRLRRRLCDGRPRGCASGPRDTLDVAQPDREDDRRRPPTHEEVGGRSRFHPGREVSRRDVGASGISEGLEGQIVFYLTLLSQ